jgi:hypothetical protein
MLNSKTKWAVDKVPMNDTTIAKQSRLRRLILAIFVTSCCSACVSASTPFANANWSYILEHDPNLRRVASDGSDEQTYLTADGRKGVFYTKQAQSVVVGSAGGEVVAAVPLDDPRSLQSRWLIYVPHVAKHIGLIEGGESLRFVNGKIVTVTNRAGRGVEDTFAVIGATVKLERERSVQLVIEGR